MKIRIAKQHYIIGGAIALSALLGFGLVFLILAQWQTPESADALPPSARPAATAGKINATLFYVSEDGLHLTGVAREVNYQPDTTEQARTLIEEQLKPAERLATAIPAGTTLRTLFLTPNGEAFVDLSKEITANHPGGSLDEMLTVYTVVNALTANLPAVKAVQILVDGKEVDSLAGHIDLRQPLQRAAEAPPPATVDGSVR